MSLPFTLPDWLPWWVPLVLLLPALLYALAFLFMPFSVIGVKSRMEVIEARLDEIQNEIRHLALRLPAAPNRAADFDDLYPPPAAPPPRPEPREMTRPPIPPAAYTDMDEDEEAAPRERPAPPPHTRPIRAGEQQPQPRAQGRPPGRSEPRLNWPR